jgi:hypothetical protein
MRQSALRNHIDFSSIIHEFDGIENGIYFTPNKKRCKHNNFCDEVNPDKLFSINDKFICEVSKQKFNKINYDYIKLAIESVSNDNISNRIIQFEESYFESVDGRYVLYMMKFEYKYGDCDFLGIFDTITNKYVTVGCCSGHPFVVTDEFIYNNSDGSTSDIVPNSNNPKEIIKQLHEYYIVLCQDRNH